MGSCMLLAVPALWLSPCFKTKLIALKHGTIITGYVQMAQLTFYPKRL